MVGTGHGVVNARGPLAVLADLTYPAHMAEQQPSLTLESMSAGMLIAVPQMRDPFFSRTVVLLVEHNQDGAYGVVLNRKAPVDLQTLLAGAGLPIDNVPEREPVWWGGPVNPESGMVLYRVAADASEPSDPAYEPGLAVSEQLRVSWSMQLLQDIASGAGPDVFALYLGRAAWAAGQLDNEIAMGAWLPTDTDSILLFNSDTSDRWRNALALIGAEPGCVIPGAPAQA